MLLFLTRHHPAAGRSCGKGAVMYQTVQSGPGALPCADDILYLRHDFLTGSLLPRFLPAPARTGLLPRIPSLQGPPFAAVLFHPPDTKRALHAQRPFFLKQHLVEGTDCPGYFSCPASPIQVCRASTILRA